MKPTRGRPPPEGARVLMLANLERKVARDPARIVIVWDREGFWASWVRNFGNLKNLENTHHENP
jgi:hypothetical protein